MREPSPAEQRVVLACDAAADGRRDEAEALISRLEEEAGEVAGLGTYHAGLLALSRAWVAADRGREAEARECYHQALELLGRLDRSRDRQEFRRAARHLWGVQQALTLRLPWTGGSLWRLRERWGDVRAMLRLRRRRLLGRLALLCVPMVVLRLCGMPLFSSILLPLALTSALALRWHEAEWSN